jgi:hypothetical protein
MMFYLINSNPQILRNRFLPFLGTENVTNLHLICSLFNKKLQFYTKKKLKI